MNCTRYLAVFPDDPANRGRLVCLPFYQNGGTWWYEPVYEIDYETYYYSKIIHKNDKRIPELVEALANWYGYTGAEKFKIMEKVVNRRQG